MATNTSPYGYTRSTSNNAPPLPIFHTTTVVAPSLAAHEQHDVDAEGFAPIPLSHDEELQRESYPRAARAPTMTTVSSPTSAPSTAYNYHPSRPATAYPPLKDEHSDAEQTPIDPTRSGAALTTTTPTKDGYLNTIKTFLAAFNTPNQLALLALIGAQAVCVLTMIGLIYATVNNAIGNLSFQDTFLQAPRLESVATYVGLFILAVIFEILVALDALQQKNIISIFLLCFFQVAMLVYSAVLPNQLSVAVRGSSADTSFVHDHVKGYAVTIPCLVAFVTCGMAFLTWRLHEEFNWELFRRVVGPEVHLRQMYLLYQIFVCVLKFDAFFFIGFSIQFLVLVTGTPAGEFAVTIAALPIICVFLFLSAIFVKHEFRPGVYLCLVVDTAGMAYFVYKLYRVYARTEEMRYAGARKTLTIFSVISLVFLVLTFCLNGLCMSNFGRGLKERIPKYAWAGRRTTFSSKNRKKRMSIAPDGTKVEVEEVAANGLGRTQTRMSLD